ncbi:MAG: hypothetical protein H6708_21705 [Kofleriaceae bacterium]|nr:hypothetical protein [Kofleriaceae bacterium]
MRAVAVAALALAAAACGHDDGDVAARRAPPPAATGPGRAPSAAPAAAEATPPAVATPARRTIAGIVVGETTAAQAVATLAGQGVTCTDASMMGMMARAHAAHGCPRPARLRAAPAAAAAMPAGHARYLSDPALQQARWACADVLVALLGDGRDGVRGRLLVVVAPGADAPVSLVAYQRTYRAGDAAVADAGATFAALAGRYGAAATARGDVPAVGAALPPFQPVERRWRFADLEVEATAVDLGRTGIAVSEELAVPAPAPHGS